MMYIEVNDVVHRPFQPLLAARPSGGKLLDPLKSRPYCCLAQPVSMLAAHL
jgi:hypothetical protein